MTDFASPRLRFPWRAKLALAAAGLFFLFELAALALWLMPLVPLVPVFILVMFGHAFVLGELVRWAASIARVEPVRERRADSAAQVASVAEGTAAASL